MDEVQRPILQGEYKLSRIIERTPDSILYFGYAIAAPERHFAVREFKVDLPESSASPERLAVVSTYFQPFAMRYMDFIHPGATCLRDFFFENGYVYFVIDYVPGYRLSEILQMRHGCPFPEMQAVSIAMQIADTMNYLHNLPNPVFMADVNVSNIILATNGTVMLTDYGLGKLLIKYNPLAVRMGTLGYAPPEQIGPAGIVNAYTDMYALGVLMHQMVTGVDPTLAPNVIKPISMYNPAISQDYVSIVEMATSREPYKRFVSMKDMAFALSSIAPQRGRSTRVVRRNLIKEIFEVFAAPFTSKDDGEEQSREQTKEKSKETAADKPEEKEKAD